MRSPKVNLAAGILLSMIGLAMMAAAIGEGILHHKNIALMMKERNSVPFAHGTQCEKLASKAGLVVTKQGRNLVLKMPVIADVNQAFNNVSLVTQSCLGYEMKSFCAGGDCPGAQIVAMLSPRK